MPLCSAACVDFHPMLTLAKHPTRTMTVPKKKQSPQPETNSEYVHDCVLSLCHLVYCHLPNISLWHLRKFTKSQSHLQQIPPISLVLPQLCAHGALKVIKQLATEFVLSLTLHQIIPPLHQSPPAVSGAPGRCFRQHPRRRPRRGAAPPRRCGHGQPPCAAVSDLRRRRARRRQRLEVSTPWLSTAHPHCSGRNCNLRSEVRELHLFQNRIASWLNGSHYRCWCL